MLVHNCTIFLCNLDVECAVCTECFPFNRTSLFWQGKGEGRHIKAYSFCRTIKKIYRLWRAVLKSVSFKRGVPIFTMSSFAQISNHSKSIFPKPSNYPPGLPPQYFLWTWQTTSQSLLKLWWKPNIQKYVTLSSEFNFQADQDNFY